MYIIRLFNLVAQAGPGTVKCVYGVICLILLSGTLPVWAETSGKMLSEQDAIRLGLDRPEILQQMKSCLELTESDIIEARTWENPEFSYDQENTNDGPDDITERSYMLTQKFIISGQKAIKTEAAKQRHDAMTLEIAQWRLERTTNIRKKFYEALYQQQVQEIYSQWRSGMDSLEEVMQKRKNAGDISGYDLGRLKQERSLLLAEQGQALAEQQRLKQELSADIGLIDGETYRAGVTGSLFPQTPPLPLENLLTQVPKQPGLMAMQLQTQAYATDERFAERSWLPDLTLGLGYKNIENAKGDALLFGVSLPIPVFDRNSGSRLRAQASRHQLQNKYTLALSDRKGTVRGLWHQERDLATVVRLLSEEDSTSLLETAKVAYNAGEIGVLEILDAYRSAFEHQAKLLALMKEARMVRIELELNTGGTIQ